MQSFDDTISYAVRVGDEIEIRILNVNGEQMRVGLGSSTEWFDQFQTIRERANTETQSFAG